MDVIRFNVNLTKTANTRIVTKVIWLAVIAKNTQGDIYQVQAFRTPLDVSYHVSQ
jgi:hypothetical protein